MARAIPFPNMPDRRSANNFLYAIEIDNGLVKVGHTKYPSQRMVEHRRALSKRGLQIVRCYAHSASDNFDAAEDELLRRLHRMGVVCRPTLEIFSGVSYGAAVNLIKQIGCREFIDLHAFSFNRGLAARAA